jgi:hypothetical protein
MGLHKVCRNNVELSHVGDETLGSRRQNEKVAEHLESNHQGLLLAHATLAKRPRDATESRSVTVASPLSRGLVSRAHMETVAKTAHQSDHEVAVAAWLERVTKRGTVESLIQAFENTFAALWQRSHLTLGEVTLTAIAERVIYTAREQFPLLAPLEIEATGLRCQVLRPDAGFSLDQLSAAIQFVLVEFLTVLGNLTAQILTPALHAELLNTAFSQDQTS